MKKLFIDKTKSKTIDSIPKLIREVEGLNCKGALYFRGQKNDKPLIPSISRKYDFAGEEKVKIRKNNTHEKNLVHRFQRYTYEHSRSVFNKWEALFLAKHHDLPVRLLDWTTNPLVALYWACKFQKKDDLEDGVIYVFWRERKSIYKDIDVINGPQDPFSIKGIRVIYPFYPTKRMTAQSGLFTIHQNPELDISKIEKAKIPKKDNDIHSGEKWLVLKKNKNEMIKLLDRLGINERTLYPELDGIARGLLNRVILFPRSKK